METKDSNRIESDIKLSFNNLIPADADEYSVSVLKDILEENRGYCNKTVLMRTFTVPTEDGCSLYTRVYSPNFDKKLPVILIRTPYSGLSSGPQMFGAAAVMSMADYAVVVQDCRGTGASDGEWIPFANERKDGLFTVEWIKTQVWAEDKIAMFGQSYLTLNQWFIADAVPKEVKTLFLTVAGTERHRQMYMNGMFRHEIYTMWAVENSGVSTNEKAGDLYQEALKIKPHIDMDEKLYNRKLPWYRDWITNPSVDSNLWNTGFWKELQEIPSRISIPVHMIAGWFDHHLDGMCEAYKNLPKSVRKKSRFIIGPWDHSFKTPGDKKFLGDIRLSTLCIKEAIEWFDYQLKDKDFLHETGCIKTYVVNDALWKSFAEWPVNTEDETFFLDMTKATSIQKQVLTSVKPQALHTSDFIYDSADPVKTIGGSGVLAWINPEFHGAIHGCVLQPQPGYRKDVLSFISEPLTSDLIIIGNIEIFLNVKSDAEDTCFSVKIMEETEGKYFNICDGISTLEFRAGNGLRRKYIPDTVTQLKIEMWPVAWKMSAGKSIRVDISSSNFPMYNIHRNKARIWSLQSEDSTAVNSVITGGEIPSCILFPCIKQV